MATTHWLINSPLENGMPAFAIVKASISPALMIDSQMAFLQKKQYLAESENLLLISEQ